MKLRLITIITLAIVNLSAAAQTGHYLQFNMGGGLHSLMYKPDDGNHKNKLGYNFNLNYSYFFADNWGAGIGVGLKNWRAASEFNYTTQIAQTDIEGDSFTRITEYNNVTELQKSLLLDIPIGAYYQLELNDQLSLIGNLGIKLMIPLNAKYEVTDGNISCKGDYSQWGLIIDDTPTHNFVNTDEKYSGEWEKKFTIGMFAKCGATYALADALQLYGGLYFDMGFNKTNKNKNEQALFSDDCIYNGSANSDRIDGMRGLSLGLELGVRWNFLE